MALGARPDGPPLPVVADRRPSSPDRRLERQRSGGSGSGKEVSDAPPPPSSEDGVPTVEETPLLGATRADRHDAAAALLRAGADPTLGDARGAKETPLLCCAAGAPPRSPELCYEPWPVEQRRRPTTPGASSCCVMWIEGSASTPRRLWKQRRWPATRPSSSRSAPGRSARAKTVKCTCVGPTRPSEIRAGRTAMHLACDRGELQ